MKIAVGPTKAPRNFRRILLTSKSIRSSHRWFELDEEKKGCPRGMT